MRIKNHHIILSVAMACLFCACSQRKTFSTNYYQENERVLTVIEQTYRALYAIKPFSVEFTDRSFNYISLEIITDSLKYMYEFEINEPRLQDTLLRYGMPARGITELISQMRAIRCIWINTLHYYTNGQEQSLVFLSIRNVAIRLPFTSEKYYILTFYAQPQYYDSEGRLLAGRTLRRLRRVNDEVFRRINDKVCYTISSRFR